MPDIAIIGPGKVGMAIGILAAKAGRTVAAVGGRDAARAAQAAAAIGPGTKACTPRQAAGSAGLVLLTVSDDAVGSVCDELAGAFAEGAVVAHCSGVLDSGVLASARARGCAVGSMHPLQTFPSVGAAIDALGGAYCFIEGDSPAVKALERLAADIGAHPVPIASGAKPLYHAAAAVACNYLAALLDAASALCRQAGIDEPTARRALAPLVRRTLENVLAEGPAAALTGPIARGDVATVRRHLAAMAGVEADLEKLYRALGRWTVALALRKGTIDAAKAATLRRLLDASIGKER
ncbi:MAG: DUF2520 domain-containing protein [Phycisphaerae bacterium]|nr:DUF2520 domain-containing protein [Phycisphaerae bacterium]